MQPCGGTLADFRETDGDRLAFWVDAGKIFVTDAYFPFYRVQVEGIRMLSATAHSGQ
jgi:hypothetical protein